MAYRLRVKASQEMVSQGSDLIGEDVPAREVPVLAVAGEGVVVPAGDDRLEREVRCDGLQHAVAGPRGRSSGLVVDVEDEVGGEVLGVRGCPPARCR